MQHAVSAPLRTVLCICSALSDPKNFHLQMIMEYLGSEAVGETKWSTDCLNDIYFPISIID